MPALEKAHLRTREKLSAKQGGAKRKKKQHGLPGKRGGPSKKGNVRKMLEKSPGKWWRENYSRLLEG